MGRIMDVDNYAWTGDIVPNNFNKELQQALVQIKRLEKIIQTEQKLRKQVELRHKKFLHTAGKFKALIDNEQKQRENVELQAHIVINRAREVMDYFFSSIFMENNHAAELLNSNFPEFNKIICSKKSSY